MSQEPAFQYIRHGQTPFFRLRMADLARDDASAYAGADAVVLGVPWDGGTTYQPGARLAPYHVRRVSAFVQSVHPGHKVDVFARVRAVDGGNVTTPPFDAAMGRGLIQREIGRVLEAGAVPYVCGGDHSITLPILRAIAAKHGPLAVVHVDAHADTSDASVWGEAFHHGTPLRHVLEEGLVAKGGLIQIGLRAQWGTLEDGDLAARHEVTVVSADDVAVEGAPAVARRVRALCGERPVYVTIDVDGIDPAYAPGTGTPVPGGLTSREALQILRGLSGVKLAGMDVVEVDPLLDHADKTCHLAAHLLYEGLALQALSARPSRDGGP